MATDSPKRQIPKPERSIIEWLLDSDPSIRWQTMRDLTGAPEVEVAAERARVATEGWGAQILASQGADGYWEANPFGAGTFLPEWGVLWLLLLLRYMGLNPTSAAARRAVARVRDNVTWQSSQGAPWQNNFLFEGEVEPCINGRVVTIGAYFGEDVQAIVERLLGEQMADGGWNCEQENGSTRGSFHSTICVLEGLLEYERAIGGSAAVTAARQRGHEYLLERGLLRRLTTGEVIDPSWTQFAFPNSYRYDVLRGLEYLRRAGVTPDARLAEAIELVLARRDEDGRWPLEDVHPNKFVTEPGVAVGRPSRWNTLHALRVLGWYSGASEQ